MSADFKEVRENAYRYAIKNAFLHAGAAQVGAVVGKVKALHPEIDLKKAMPLIQEVVSEVNGKNFAEIEKEYKTFEAQGYELKPQEKKEGLPELEWAKQGVEVVTRFAPNPNAPFHLGNARAAIISHTYARMYDGKFILRFDDTDPKVKRSRADAEQLFTEDLNWLEIKPDEQYFASDRLEIYYKYMRELIGKGKIYACCCESEKWKLHIDQKEACPCREQNAEEHAKIFEEMLAHTRKEGSVVLRMKTDLTHKDPSVRDWWVAKVVDVPEHPRMGSTFHVWPSYNFASAIDDHEMGITLIVRGQEHEQNGRKQKYLYEYLGWEYPHEIYFGRVKLQGTILSKSQMEKGIQEGKYTGYDDPRLGTIRAFRRRGFVPQALRDVILFLGIKSTDTTIEWSFLANENKKYVEKIAVQGVFLSSPIRLHVDFSPQKSVELNGVQYELRAGHQSFLVDRKQLEQYGKAKIVRLKQAYNVRIKSMDVYEAHAEYVADIKIKETIPWLLEEESCDAEVVMPTGEKLIGSAERKLLDEEIGSILQLEYFGFARLDEKDHVRVQLYFTHK